MFSLYYKKSKLIIPVHNYYVILSLIIGNT